MPREDRATWKSNYFLKIIQLLGDYPKCFVVDADNVGPKQMQQIRMSLRGKAVVLMGKNTVMCKAIRGHLDINPALEKLLPHIRGNVGFVFIKEDLTEVRDMLRANKVPAVAHAGAIAPCEVTVPAQNTGLGPENTAFFQTLDITTKISRGTIEILSDVELIKTGDKVGAREATLLNTLNISPFSLGLIIQQVFDNGSIYNPEVIDITEETLHTRFLEGVRNVASVCLQIGYPLRNEIDKVVVQGNASPRIKNGRVGVTVKIIGDHLVFSVSQNAREGSF
ncbi:PREDICTED: 60S acidic ribosomal protein P0-like [Elephantulus edwardii]|uniref:60S acidic ribosomal protein P0-like n=1 Tax=Elephantulus edwardii TaxID=28737 RepID=UPI0003F0CF95|nr:PREDICTED: 60S acidic ribosomal protein P0-like [Elephantulus edwardii]